MKPWRRVSTLAIASLCACVLVACSGTDGDNNQGGGSGGGDDNFTAETNARLNIPEAVNFTQVKVGEETTAPITIANDGDDVLEIDKIKLVEGTEDEIKEFHAGDNWVNKTTIEPNGSIDLAITYAPKNKTQDSGRIELKTNDPRKEYQNAEIPLKPRELAPRLLTDNQVNFSGIRPGSRASKVVTLENVGQAKLNINKIQLTDSDLFKVTKFVDQSGSDDGGDDDKKMGQQGEEEPAGPKPEEDAPISEVEGTSLKPGESVGTMKIEMPLCLGASGSVRAASHT